MRPPFVKVICYLLEGLNAFATAYYFNYLMFLLQKEYQFDNKHNLAVGAVHGLIYVVASWLGGKIGQKAGYFSILRIGFIGMALSVLLGGIFPSIVMQLVALTLWTITMCLTWPMLEAMVAEHEDAAALPHRLGLYNVVWAASAAAAYFSGGMIFESLGLKSLYWLPFILHVIQFILTFPLKKWHDDWLAKAPPIRGEAAVMGEGVGKPRYFQKLAFMANPFSYMTINTLLAVVPGIAANNGLSVAEAGRIMSLWFMVRAASFVVLWFWHGWHYRFGWFVAAFIMLGGGFLSIMLANAVWQLIVAQIVFGLATGLIYYSSLFYAMDGSEAKGEHGGIHEALIGAGICGGPAIGAASLYLAPGHPTAAAWAVGTILLAGFGGLFKVRAAGK
ncbi:MAG TPA: MFS transporter [Verrucomicrobiae bacterium]